MAFNTPSLAPPRLTRNEAEARTLIAQRLQRRACQLGDMAWTVSLEPLAQQARTAFGDDDWLVQAEWGGAPFELRLPAAAADRWLGARFQGLELPQLPPPLRSAAFESALHDVLAALEDAGQGAVRIDTAQPQAGPATAAPRLDQHFGLALSHGEQVLWGSLSTDTLGLMLVAGQVSRWHAAQGPVAADDVPVLLRAEVGTATLTRAELDGLRPGDAVLVQHGWTDGQACLWLGQGRWGLRAEVGADGAQLRVTEPFQFREDGMTDDLPDALPGDATDAPAEAAVSLDELPVHLHFDLGQRSLCLAEVTALQVGQVLELARPLSQAVSIRANGALIGRGELLQIGGRIAVGITALGRERAGEP